MSEATTIERETAVPVAERQQLLRVYGGRLDGAEQLLPAAGVIRIGHDFDNSLVLRGRGTNGIAVALHQQVGGSRLQVLSGAVTLLGCEIKADGRAVLPPFVPLTMGEYSIAIGETESERWAEVAALIANQATAAASTADHTKGEPSDDILPLRREGVQRWVHSEAEAIGRKLHFTQRPGLLIAAAGALVALILAQPAFETIKTFTNSPAALQADLANAGYDQVRVKRDPTSGALVVEGRVKDDRSVERLGTLVGDGYGPVTLSLTTMSGAATALNSLLQSQGVDAEAVPGRDGLVVHTEYLPQDRLAALRTRIAADLPDTGPINFVRDQDRGPRDLQYFFASDRFGLASLVEGDPGHIVTADGQYWFAGSLLPTGHRLLSVGHGEIRFERDGLVETLRVTGAADSPTGDVPEPSPSADLAGRPTFTAASATRTSAG